MKIFIIFWILFEIAQVHGKLTVTLSTDSKDYINAVQIVLDKVIFKHRNAANLITAAKTPLDKRIDDFINSLMRHKNYIFRLLNHSMLSKCYRENCIQTRNNNVFIIDSLESFSSLNKSLTTKYFDMRGHYLLLFPLGRLSVGENQQIIKSMWTKGIYNLILAYEEGSAINMTTFWPFRDGLCVNTAEASVDIYRNESFVYGNFNHMFSADKLKNLNKCPVKVVTFARCPAVCYDKRQQKYVGYDKNLIDELSIRLNFTIDENFLHGYQKWGTVHTNGSLSGALVELNESRAEIGIGNYYLRHARLALFDATVAYYSTPVVLVVPPGRPYTSFEKLLQPFDIITWMFLIVTFSIGFFVIIIVSLKFKNLQIHLFGDKVNDPMMNMLAAILGLQQNILPKRNFARIILMLFLIFCLVLRNVYQGALFKFLQSNDRHKHIEDIDEMVEKQFDFYNTETEIIFKYEPKKDQNFTFKRKIIYEESDLPFNRRVDHTLNAAFLTTVIDIIYRNKRNHGRLALIYAKEPITTMSIVMYLKRNFYLKNALDEKISNFDSAGLISHWIEEHASKRYLNVDDDNAGIKQINLDHLIGIFMILVAGNCVAFVIFIVEVIVWKINEMNMSKMHEFVN